MLDCFSYCIKYTDKACPPNVESEMSDQAEDILF